MSRRDSAGSAGPFCGTAGERHRRAARVRLRRALGLLAITLLLPGSAQLVAGSKALGRAALRVEAMLVIGLVGGYLYEGRTGLVRLALTPWFLTAVQVSVAVLGICWLGLFVDAWRLGRPFGLSRLHRPVTALLALSLMGGVAAPVAYGASLAGVQREFVRDVFVPGGVGELYRGRLNIALLGGDGGLDRAGIRTDSLSVVSVDVSNGRAVLISVPRNMQGVEFPPATAMAKQFPNGFPDFLYGVYTYAAVHPDLFPGSSNPGATATEQALAQLLGIPIHYYVVMNLDGFQDVVNAIGGVTIRVNERLNIGGGHATPFACNLPGGGCPEGKPLPILGHIEPGLQHLNGYRALWYARSRSNTNDYDRMARQRCFLGAVLHEADPLTGLRNYQTLAKAAKKVVVTDLTTGALQELVAVAAKTKNTRITNIQLTPPIVSTVNPDIAAVRGIVSGALDRSRADAGNWVAASAAPTPTNAPAGKAAATKASTKGARKPVKSLPSPHPIDVNHTANGPDGAPVAVDDACQYS